MTDAERALALVEDVFCVPLELSEDEKRIVTRALRVYAIVCAPSAEQCQTICHAGTHPGLYAPDSMIERNARVGYAACAAILALAEEKP